MCHEKMRSQIIVVCLVVMGLIVGFAGIVSAKDTLVIGMQDDTASLDPAKTYEIAAWGILSQIYEKLVDFDKDDVSQHIPELAESWEIGEDGKTWMFHLREGVQFSSGNPVNADAVVFSLRRAIKLAGPASWLLTQFGLTEESISKIDDTTVQIVLGQQYAPALFLSCLSSITASIIDPAVMEYERGYDMGSAWLEDHSAGAGPYMLVERNREEPGYYVLKTNAAYWGNPPAFQELVVKRVQEPLDQMFLLENGKLDVAWNLTADQLTELSDNPDFQVVRTATLTIVYFMMNVGYEPFSKPKVRDAVRYAIDYDGIIRYTLQGGGELIQTIIPKGLLGYNPSAPYSFSPDKAKALLSEAGYSNGFAVEYACLNFSPHLDIARQVKDDLAKVGITVAIKPVDASVLFDVYLNRNSQIVSWEWLPDYVDPDMNAKGFAHSDSPNEDASVQLLAWWGNYVNIETSQLVERAAQELDLEKRKDLYYTITEIILDDGPFAILYSPFKQYAVRAEVSGLLGTPSVLVISFPLLR